MDRTRRAYAAIQAGPQQSAVAPPACGSGKTSAEPRKTTVASGRSLRADARAWACQSSRKGFVMPEPGCGSPVNTPPAGRTARPRTSMIP